MIITLGITYPLFKSVHALESSDSEEMKRWLIYWMTFTSLSAIDVFEPGNFYWTCKCLMQIILMLPKTDAVVLLVFEQMMKISSRLRSKQHHVTVAKEIDKSIAIVKTDIDEASGNTLDNNEEAPVEISSKSHINLVQSKISVEKVKSEIEEDAEQIQQIMENAR